MRKAPLTLHVKNHMQLILMEHSVNMQWVSADNVVFN